MIDIKFNIGRIKECFYIFVLKMIILVIWLQRFEIGKFMFVLVWCLEFIFIEVIVFIFGFDMKNLRFLEYGFCFYGFL